MPSLPESEYVCDSCGEPIVIPIDPSAGELQEYVEDCPVCCCPNALRVAANADGSYSVHATAE